MQTIYITEEWCRLLHSRFIGFFYFILFIRVDRTGYRISPALLPHHLVRILPSHGRLRAYELPISSRCASVASPDQRDSSGLTSRLVSRRLTDLLSTKLRRPAMSHFRVSAWKAPRWRRLVVFSGSHSVAKCHGFSRPSPHNLHSGISVQMPSQKNKR